MGALALGTACFIAKPAITQDIRSRSKSPINAINIFIIPFYLEPEKFLLQKAPLNARPYSKIFHMINVLIHMINIKIFFKT